MQFLRWLYGLLQSECGQVPSSVTDSYDALLTTTLRAYRDRIADNISRGNKFLAWLKSKGRFRSQNGGYNVRVPLMHQLNSTADIMSGYGAIDTMPQDGITSAFYDWAQMAVSITISDKEKMQNSGEGQAIDLLKTKTMQSEVSLKELANNCMLSGRITASSAIGQFYARIGRQDSGATGPLPLSVLIDANASRSVSVGNINGNTYSFWRNQIKASSATTFAGLKLEMGNLYNTCSKGGGGSPDLLIGDQAGWETYFGALSSLERYTTRNEKSPAYDVLGGSENLAFRGATFIWDEVVPDVQTTAEIVDGIGTVTESTIYFINSETFDYVYHPQANFTTTPFVRPENQLASTAIIHWMGAVGVNERRKNGVMFSISQSITS